MDTMDKSAAELIVNVRHRLGGVGAALSMMAEATPRPYQLDAIGRLEAKRPPARPAHLARAMARRIARRRAQRLARRIERLHRK